MKAIDRRREAIFDIVQNQMKDNNPPETNLAYKRLIDLKFSDFETKQLIGQCVAVELYQILKFKQPFNLQRYIRNLTQLPAKPKED